jgi:hypothetical protein
MPAMGSSPEGKGKGERRQGEGCRRGCHGGSACSWLFLRAVFVLNVSRKQEAGRRRRGGTREEKEKEGKGKKEKI